MYRKLLNIIAPLLLSASAWGQGFPLTYENDGLVLAPPAIAPTIDAENFINNGRFIINFTNGSYIFFSPPPAELLPFEMQNVLRLTNTFGSLMSCDLGFRFQYFNPEIGQRLPMESFVNNGTINSGTRDTSNFVITAGERFIGTSNVFLLGVEGNRFIMSATNIFNPGAINMGFNGFLRMEGDLVNLSLGSLSMETVGASAFDTTLFFNGGVFDNTWGLSTNVMGSPAAFFGGGVPTTPFYSATNRDYQIIIERLVLTNQLSYYSDEIDDSLSNRWVRAVFISNTNAAFEQNVYMPTFGNGTPFAPDIIVEFTNVLGTASNNLYVLDYFGILTNYYVVANGFGGARATFIPFNYVIFTNAPIALGPPTAASAIPGGTFNSDNSTNEYSSYQALFQPLSYVITDVAGQDVTNAPGRIEITADKYMDLTGSRISSLNYLGLKSPVSFGGSVGASISAPYVDLDLRTTNGTFAVTNLLAPSLGRPEGTMDLWSARWTNVTTSQATGGSLTNHYHVLFVDARFSDRSPSRVQDLSLKVVGGDDQIFISDILNITRSFQLDARSITITTNDPSSASPSGGLNLLDPSIVWSTGSPRLQNLTNNGYIQALNTIFFGGSRTSPYYTSNFNEPYYNFVNTGNVWDFATLIWATNFINSGLISASQGSISLQKSVAAVLTNGAFLASSPAGQISIQSGSLIVSNHTLQAGSSLSLTVTNFLDDGSYSTLVNQVTNKNIWNCGNGFNLYIAPAYGSLLATTVTNSAGDYQASFSRWAGADYGATPEAYTSKKTNNAPLGRLILNGGTNSLFSFVGTGVSNALYVDYLELDGFTATNQNSSGEWNGILVASNITIYYAQAIAAGVTIAAKLNGQNNGHLRWISNYNCGFYSSTNLVYLDGVTNQVNAALAELVYPDFIPGPFPNCNISTAPTPVFPTNTNIDGSTSGVPTTVSAVHLTTPDGLKSGTNISSGAFVLAQGVYNGLFYETNGIRTPSSGYFTAKTTSRGTYSAKLSIGARSYSLSGQFDANSGHSIGTVKGAGGLSANLQLDMAGGGHLNGVISGPGFSSELFSDRAAGKFNQGSYTIIIPAAVAASNSIAGPAGDGYAAVKVSSKGAIVASGTLADGSRFSLKSAVSDDGIWPVYSAPYRSGGGLLISWLQFTNASAGDLGGQLIWLKPPGSLGLNYSQGFTNNVEALGSAYHRPVSGSPALDLTAGRLLFLGAGLSLTNSITLGSNNKTGGTEKRLSLSITTSSGLFKGVALDAASGQKLNFQGAVLQNTNIGRGFFLNANQSGGVRLVPAP